MKKIIGISSLLAVVGAPILTVVSCSSPSDKMDVKWDVILENWQKSSGYKNADDKEVELRYLAYYLEDFKNFNKFFKDENLKSEYETKFQNWISRNKNTDGTMQIKGEYKKGHKMPKYSGISKLFYAWAKMNIIFKNKYGDSSLITEKDKLAIHDPIFESLYMMENRVQKQSSEATGGFSTMNEFYWQNRSKFWNDLNKWAKLYNLKAYESRKPLTSPSDPVKKYTNNYYKNPDLLKVIKYTLSSIVDDKFYYNGQQQYVNWWHYEIGFPRYIFNFILPIRKEISNVEANKYMSGYNYFKSDPLYGRTAPTAINNYRPAKKMLSTGANLADNALNGLKAAILNRDAKKLHHSVSIMYDFIFSKFSTSGDGFYRDGGFIQHSNIPYIGTYGGELLKSVANAAIILDGTNNDLFKVNPKFRNIFPIIEKSIMPFIYRGNLSSTVGGRGITRTGSEFLGVGLLRYISMLEKYSVGKYKENLKNFLAQNINQLEEDMSKLPETDILSIGWNSNKKNEYIQKWIGKKYKDVVDYSNMKKDKTIHQIQSIDRVIVKRKEWSMSTSFHSTRVGNFEAMNGENLQGMYQGDGMTLLQTKKDSNPYTSQYWWGANPYRLPGTTVDNSTKSKTDANVVNGNDNWRKWTDQNSGKSLLGITGGTTLDDIGTSFGVYTNFTEKLKTKKSMFMLEDEVLFLGKTNNSDPNGKIYTTIDNRMGGSFEKNGRKNNFIYTSDNGSKIGYRVLGNNPIKEHSEDARQAWLSNRRYGKKVKGNDKFIGDTKYAIKTTKKFNSITMDHDSQLNEKFAYVITPGVSSFSALENLQTRIKVIENSDSRHSIEYTNSKGEEYLMVNYLSKSSGTGKYDFLFSPAMKAEQLRKAKTIEEKNEIEKMASVEIKSDAPASFIFKRFKVDGIYRYKMSAKSAEIGNSVLKLKFNKEIKAFRGPLKRMNTRNVTTRPDLDIEEAIANLKIQTQWAEKTRIKLEDNVYFTDIQGLTLHFDERYKFNNSIIVEFTLGE